MSCYLSFPSSRLVPYLLPTPPKSPPPFVKHSTGSPQSWVLTGVKKTGISIAVLGIAKQTQRCSALWEWRPLCLPIMASILNPWLSSWSSLHSEGWWGLVGLPEWWASTLSRDILSTWWMRRMNQWEGCTATKRCSCWDQSLFLLCQNLLASGSSVSPSLRKTHFPS